jgi:tetratricopeptide (TPR) repeat protein
MQRFLSALALIACLGFQPALAEAPEGPPAESTDAAKPEALTPQAITELTLDQLFDKLPDNAGSRAGKAIEREILARFNKSGSATADLLLSWASEAIDKKDYPHALDILDQIVVIQPDFAEAWNKRATVYYLTDDYSSSLSDIRQTLALEPRHFGALAGLGMILDATDRKEEAIRVLERALEINPQLDNVRESLERLEKDVAGDSI